MTNISKHELEVNEAFNEATSYEALAEKLDRMSEEGNAYAILNLATFYEKGMGVEQNNSQALSRYLAADVMGLPEAKYQMGLISEFGRCNVAPSNEIAAKIYREAADLGHAEAQFRLGGLYYRGVGIGQDLVEAARYFKLAADNGVAQGKFFLAESYLNGQGVVESLTEALNLYHQAAQLGHGFSQLILANRYRHGDALPRDYVKAYSYANLAANSTQDESDKAAAIGLRDEIFALMSDDDKKAVLP